MRSLALLTLSFCIGTFLSAQQTLPFFEDFESGIFDPNAWTIRTNIDGGVNGVIQLREGIGLSNTKGVEIGKLTDNGGFTTNALDLSLNLSGETNVELTFWISNSYDDTDEEDGIYFSDNGGNTFTKVVDFITSEWCPNIYGRYPSIDVDRLAASAGLSLNNQFVIRFQQKGEDDFSGNNFTSEDGFYLDNIGVYDPNLTYATLPFEDDFEDGVFNDSWTHSFADLSTSNPTPGINSPMGIVDIFEGIGLNGTDGVFIGRRCDGVFSNNALDLHLDLSGETNVEMTFWIGGSYDETDEEDGIYFSDNGGVTFTKVVDFVTSEWCPNVYGRYPSIDIDRTASAAGLSLTNQFVIRFQQRGQDDSSGNNSTSEDGFYLDDVRVYDPNLTYATLPFLDDFEDGEFNDSWTHSFADLSSSNPTPSITSPMSIVDVFEGAGLNGTDGVFIGRRCDGAFINNALDLHLDLSGETDVEMTFWVSSSYDETDEEDGIYFSDNGGITFTKVVDFITSEWCPITYGKYPPLDVDRLAAAAGLSLTDQFVVRFQQRGEDDFNGNNSTSEDGFYLDDVRVYDPNLTYATLPFTDNFEDGKFKDSWAHNFADSSSNNPSAGITSPMSVVDVFDGVGLNNSYGVSVGRRCDGAFTINALDLHLDLSGETDVEMTFWVSSSYDETDEEDGIYFSDNGGITFTKVVDFITSEWCPITYGKHPPLDIDRLAAAAGLSLTDQFVVRFQQRGEDDFSGNNSTREDGFYLDDVRVYDPNLTYATLPFTDDFEDGKFKDSWAHNFADSSSDNPSAGITSPMSIVDVFNGVGLNSSYGVLIGRRCDGAFTNNALDLHLNLSNETNVEMTFWIGSSYDETNEEDGIYFSDNGGITFTKVVDFITSEWCANIYGKHPPLDIDKLAAAAGLNLTDQFVIRFQQRGEDDFNGNNSTSEDGFYLDDVRVYDPNLTYATLPFIDDFEQGVFNESWAHNFANITSTIDTTSGITSPMSVVDVFDNVGINSSYGVFVGRWCDGAFTTNALDLHLNLANQEKVALSFWLLNNYDNTDSDDGIFFSNDGGVTFEKVFDFDFTNTAINVYQEYMLDVEALALQNSISFSDQFVIRFQQRGEDDFNGNSFTSEDGFYLDDVNVSSMTTSLSSIDSDYQIALYPNPTSSLLRFELLNKEERVSTYSVTNLSGQEVISSDLEIGNSFDVQVGSLPSGIYYLIVGFENGSRLRRKFVKQ